MLQAPGCCLPSGLPGHTVGSPRAAVNQHPQIPSCRAAQQPLLSCLFCCLNVMPLRIGQCSKLVRSLCKASGPSRASTALSSVESSASLLMVHSNPSSRSLINTWDRTGPGAAPRGAPLVAVTSLVQPHHCTTLSSALQPGLHPAHCEPAHPTAAHMSRRML